MKQLWLVTLLICTGGNAHAQGSLVAPTPLYPENDGFNWTAAFFAWTSTPVASAYQFQISRDSTLFEDIALDTTVVDTSFGDNIFEPNGWYHWRVRAINQADTSAWSEIRRFKLMFPVSVEPRNETTPRLSLGTVYPNPSRASVTLAYEIANPTEVSIEMFNAVGQRVRLYKMGLKSAGSHSVNWDVGSLPSGFYVARMKAAQSDRAVSFIITR